jgi:hypothetical protein
MGVGGQRHAPAALTPGKNRYPLYRRLGGLQGRSGGVRKISPPLGLDPPTVQPVAISPFTRLFKVRIYLKLHFRLQFSSNGFKRSHLYLQYHCVFIR